MAYKIYDYQGNLLGEEEDSVIEERLALGSSPDGLNFFWYDSHEDDVEIFDTWGDYETPENIRVAVKVVEDEI